MIVMIVIGWVIVLPLAVVVGLLCASKVLGCRARVKATTGTTDMTAFARQFPAVSDSAALVPAKATNQAANRTVSAGY